MFGIGGFELFLILLFGFLIFGPEKLPEIAKTVGKAIAKFRSAQDEMNSVIKGEVFDKDSAEPFKNPLDLIDNAASKAQKAGTSAKKTAAEISEKAESFSERKARYDRERAARKAAEQEAAEKAAAQGAQAGSDAAASEGGPAASAEAAAKPNQAVRPSAAELYGTGSAVAVRKKPAAKQPAAAPGEDSSPLETKPAADAAQDAEQKGGN